MALESIDSFLHRDTVFGESYEINDFDIGSKLEKEIEEIYRRFDANHNDFLNHEECIQFATEFFQYLQEKLPEDQRINPSNPNYQIEIEKLVKIMLTIGDKDKNQFLELGEFKTIFYNFRQFKSLLYYDMESIEMIEKSSVFDILHYNGDPESVRGFFNKYDLDHDGKLNKTEVSDFVNQFVHNENRNISHDNLRDKAEKLLMVKNWLLHSLGMDESGALTWEEMVHWLENIKDTLKKYKKYVDEEVKTSHFTDYKHTHFRGNLF